MSPAILNVAQQQAVDTINGPILVAAGAGTGKTRVLEYRTLSLVKSGVDPKSILLLTFTRRAAAEMLARAARHDMRCREVAGGTFHSFSLGLLQRYGKLLNLNAFTVLDRADSEEIIGTIIAQLNLRDKKYFPKKRTVTDILSKSVNKLASIETVLEDDYPHLYEWAKPIELIGARAAAYKRERNLLDFDDLLFYLQALLAEHEGVRRRIHEKYQYIMVDEYQDTNKIQEHIVYQLGVGHGNILVVGDEMQSIYRFRGAEYANMIRFPKRFGGTHIVKLEENYRSTQEILDVANAVIDQVAGEHFKKYLASDRSGEKPVYKQFKSPREEAAWVADTILERVNAGISLRSIAVLFRAAYQSAPLELELAARRIPFKKYGGIRFVETAHVKDVLAHLKVIANPQDELSWRRILLLIEGIGEKTVDKLFNSVVIKLAGLLEEKNEAQQAAQLHGEEPFQDQTLSSNLIESLRPLYYLLVKIKDPNLRPSQKIADIVEYYGPILRQRFDDYPQREQDLTALVELSQPYDHDEDLINDFALDPPDQSAVDVRTYDDDFLTLSTVHSAKGLEWNTVFIIQALEGKFPIVRPESKPEDIEEERRLFYVAVTRAKERLYLSSTHGRFSGYYDSWYMNKPSRFIESLLDKDVLESTLLTSNAPFGSSSSQGNEESEEDVDMF